MRVDVEPSLARCLLTALIAVSILLIEPLAATADVTFTFRTLDLKLVAMLAVTSREVVRLFLEQLRFDFVPVFHYLQGRFAV